MHFDFMRKTIRNDRGKPGGMAMYPALPGMRRMLLASILLATAGAAVACAPVSAVTPQDVGNMAYPEPLPQGSLRTTGVTGRGPQEVGNMAYPAPLAQGLIGTTTVPGRQRPDTGNMAYPDPARTGEIAKSFTR